MNCQETVLLLSEYDRQQLSEDESLAVSEHLSHCEECPIELEKTRELKQILSTGVQPMPEGYTEHFWQTLETKLDIPPSLGQRLKAFWLQNKQLSLAFAVLLVALILPLKVLKNDANLNVGNQQTMAPSTERNDGFIGGEELRPESQEEEQPVSQQQVDLLKNDDERRKSSLKDRSESKGMLLGSGGVKQEEIAPSSRGRDVADTDKFNDPQMLVKKGTLQLEIKDVAEAFRQVEGIVEKQKGYIVDAQLDHHEHAAANARILVKLPRDNFKTAIHGFEQLGIVRSKQLSSEDSSLNFQNTKLAIDNLETVLKQTKIKEERLRLEQQLSQHRLSLARLEKQLKMATLELQLNEKYVPRLIDWERMRQQLTRALRQTVNAFIDLLTILPPLIFYAVVIFAIWLSLKWIVVTKLALLSTRTLGGILLLAAIYFPLYFNWQREFVGFLIFGCLLGGIWAIKTIIEWFRNRNQSGL